MMLALAAIFSLAILWLALGNLRWAVFALAALLPIYLVRFSIGTFPSTLLEAGLIIVILTWGIKHRGFRLRDARTQPWALPMILLLFAGGAGIVMAPDPVAALGLFRAYLLEPALFFFVVLTAIRTKKDLRLLLGALALSALILSLYAIFQRLTGFGIPAPWNAELRVTSVYPFPNALGLFLGPLIPIFVALGIQNIMPKTKPAIVWGVFFWIAAALSALAIIFSKTEGAWVGLLVGLFVVGITAHKTKIITAIIGAVIVLLVAGVPVIRESAVQKLTFQDWSGQVRRTQWIETAEMLRDHSFFGAGLSGYPVTIRPYHGADYIEIFQYPHNILLNFWSELGILGIIAFGWLLLVFGVILRFAQPEYRWLRRGIAAGLIALVVHGLVDVPYFKNDLAAQFWILAAVATFIAFPDPQKPASDDPREYLRPTLPPKPAPSVQKQNPGVE